MAMRYPIWIDCEVVLEGCSGLVQIRGGKVDCLDIIKYVLKIILKLLYMSYWGLSVYPRFFKVIWFF